MNAILILMSINVIMSKANLKNYNFKITPNMKTQTIEKATLYFQQGSSDKVYKASLEQQGKEAKSGTLHLRPKSLQSLAKRERPPAAAGSERHTRRINQPLPYRLE